MTFHEELYSETAIYRSEIFDSKFCKLAESREWNQIELINFVEAVNHYFLHAIPLLQLCKSKISNQYLWLQEGINECIEELHKYNFRMSDISNKKSINSDVFQSENTKMISELLVAYSYDMLNRVNPIGFPGIVWSLFDIMGSLSKLKVLPLELHPLIKAYEPEFTEFYADLIEDIEEIDKSQVIRCAKLTYQLYLNQ